MKKCLLISLSIIFLLFLNCQNAIETDNGIKPFEVDSHTIALYHMEELTGKTIPEAVNRWPGVNSGAEPGNGIRGKALLFNSGNYAKLDIIIPVGLKARYKIPVIISMVLQLLNRISFILEKSPVAAWKALS